MIIIKRISLSLLLTTTASVASMLKRENIQELDIVSIQQRSRDSISKGCMEDTLFLGDNTDLQNNFTQVLETFSDSFSTRPGSFCKSSKNGNNVDTECVVNYSLFSTTDMYKSTCNDLGATNYPVSILMRCTKDVSYFLEMELINIPACIGKSCDNGHLYLTLVDVLSAIETSIGSGEDWNWKCHFYHDFESLLNAPATVIEIVDSKIDSKIDSKGISRSKVSILSVLAAFGATTYSSLYG